ncbi:MAG TPA: cytosine permease [Thermoplasmata archaeon]|nr:cytosine permease [Thermoplasmata archaeon]
MSDTETERQPDSGPVEYGGITLKVEPFGIEHITDRERHGRPSRLFPFWFGANATLYSFLVGFLGIAALRLPVDLALEGVVLGTVLGSIPFALLSIVGPATGYPQIAQSRSSFGRRGAYLPAALNWFSTTGWSAVTFILGGLAFSLFLPIPFALGVAIFAVIQIVVAFYGHNFLHRFEQVMALILVGVFAVMSVVAVQGATAAAYAPSGGGIAGFAFMTILAASIPLSWAPYAADFSRYLARDTARRRVFVPAFLGMAVACIWVEAIGVLLTTYLGSWGDPVLVFAHAFGDRLVVPLLFLLVVNLLAANAPNLYSSGLSLLALDVPVRRGASVLVGGAIATGLAVWGGTDRISFYEGWLFFVEYWIAPWAAIVLISFFVFRHRGAEPSPDRAPPWRVPALAAYIAAVLVAVSFMNRGARFVGPVSSALGGVDLSNLVSFAAASLLFYTLTSWEARRSRARVDHPLVSESEP